MKTISNIPHLPCLLTPICLLFLATLAPASPLTNSPDGAVSLNITTDASGHLTYNVAYHGASVVAPSRLGITVDGKDLGQNVEMGQPTTRTIDETYPLLGVHSIATNHCHETIIPITGGPDKTPWTLEVRVFNDGAAYRYRVPGQGNRKVNGETSSWVMPPAAKIWFQNDLGSYEGLYNATTTDAISPETIVAFPTTLQLPDKAGYATLTEANLANYSDMVLKADGDHALNAFFHAESDGWIAKDEIISPWRVTIVAPDLNTLVNSDIVHNLCPAPSAEMAKADWIKPGRSSWQWWNSGGPKLEDQHQWVDWTRQLGFEYYLIDEGWGDWKPKEGDIWTHLKEIVDYATSQNVKIFIWVNSKQVFKPEDRQAYFAKAKACGVVGIKIDFPPRGSVPVINWYEDTLRDAAALHFMIDFHGAVKPTGRDRTWPNEINREGIRGHEYHISRYHRVLPPEHDTILPFTRYIAGHADYTPTAFVPKELLGYTWSRELAQAVVFTSPFLCYCDHPKYYLENPALDVLQAIPPVWDETIALRGSEIGKVVAFARRKGTSWFIGVINGAEEGKLDIDLKFLGGGKFDFVKVEDVPGQDAALKKTQITAQSTDHVMLDIRAKGGFVGWLKPAS